jgi:O-glycosyl hydrolase
MNSPKTRISFTVILFFIFNQSYSQNVITLDTTVKFQIIDGFGSHQGSEFTNQQWWLDLFYKDMEASIYRVDLTPRLRSPYSDLSYLSPWFMGSQTNSIFNLEDPDNPNGPENNRVRTYTSPQDYMRSFGGQNAQIAVMGPKIEDNIQFFRYTQDKAITMGQSLKSELGDFKLIGSLWSPVPWVKVSSGDTYTQNWWPGPVNGVKWPFIWGGNFAGGKLDVTNAPLDVFNDGVENTSSITQFVRSTAAYISGYQKFHGVRFYAISIQNELNFEQFYNSATYPLSSQYITAIKAIKEEFSRHEDLKNIKLMGPEDLLGGDPYGMWQYGGGSSTIHKNLQYLSNIGQDAKALEAVDFFCIHGYANDGVTSAGANPKQWDWWSNGWGTSPAAGIPANVKGFKDYGKKSWMTETSGEKVEWLSPANGFPSDGAFSLAIRIHQALTAGNESAWIYWTFASEEGSEFDLTTPVLGNSAPKFVAAKHFFKYIRPDARRVECRSSNQDILSSGYVDKSGESVTMVLVNTTNTTQDISINSPLFTKYDMYISDNAMKFDNESLSTNQGKLALEMPAYSVATLKSKRLESSTDEDFMSNTNLSLSPNPAYDHINLSFTLSEKDNVKISIVDMNGKNITTLVDMPFNQGNHHINQSISLLPRGKYHLILSAGSKQMMKEFVVMR